MDNAITFASGLLAAFLFVGTSHAQWETPTNTGLGAIGGSNPPVVATHTHLIVDGTYRTSDNGATWETMGYAIPSNKPSAMFHHDGRVFSGHNASGDLIYYSDDQGDTWQVVQGGPTTGQVYGFHELNGDLFAYGPFGVYKSPDAGLNWSQTGSAMGVLVAMTSLNGDLFATSTGNTGVWKSDDAGDSWAQSNSGISGFDLFGDHVWTMGGEVYYRSQGGTFLFRSDDQGATWQGWANPWGNRFLRSTLVVEDRIYVRLQFTSESIRISRDGGVTFEDITQGLPSALGELRDPLVEFGGYVWAFSSTAAYRLDLTLLPVDREQAHELPDGFELYPNYPNPFNPSTTISFQVGQTDGAARVRLSVHDALGKVVATLVDGVHAPGMHRVDFQAGDLPSGTYFYRLEVGGQITSRPMVLLK